MTGDVACDQYHLYPQDIALAKSLNQKSYRFSISWPRIQPTGIGAPNTKGLDYYSRFVDALLAAGIRPWCTMYHWDLPQALEDRGGWPNRDLAGYFADYAGILAKHLGDRITVWAPFNMPWAIAFMGYAAGAFPPCRTSFSDFLKAAHTLALAQGEAHRAVKAASPHATVGSAYEMAPAYPKTDSEDDRAAAARYHAMNNVFFLEAAMTGHYPKAFVGEPPYDVMGFKAGDEKLLYAPLDWVGFHYYTRRIVSDASKEKFESGGNFSGTEIENNSPGGRDPYTRFRAAMPTEGPLTEAGLEVWPRGIYDLVTQISREYNHPIIEITESGCGYLDGPNEETHGSIPDRAPHPVVPRNAGGTCARHRRRSPGPRLPCLDFTRQFPMGRGLHRAIWIDLHRLPQPETHDQGLWTLVRPGRCLESTQCVRPLRQRSRSWRARRCCRRCEVKPERSDAGRAACVERTVSESAKASCRPLL